MGDFLKTAWNEGAAPGISAAQLNRMEAGIGEAFDESVRVLARSNADVQIVNTITEGSLFSHTIPAGILGATGGVRLTAVGQILNNSGATEGLRFRVKLGSESSLLSNYTQLFPSSYWRRWHLVAWFLNSNAAAQNWGAVLTIGASQNGTDTLPIWDSSGVWSSHLGIGINNNGAVNTGNSQLLDLRAQFDAADALLTIYKLSAFLEKLPAT